MVVRGLRVRPKTKVPALIVMSVTIEWQDQHGRWVRFQQMTHAPSAWITAKRRAAATGKRHRLVDEQGALMDLVD